MVHDAGLLLLLLWATIVLSETREKLALVLPRTESFPFSFPINCRLIFIATKALSLLGTWTWVGPVAKCVL